MFCRGNYCACKTLTRWSAGAVAADGDELQVARVVPAGNYQELSGEKPQDQDCHSHGQAAEHEALRVSSLTCQIRTTKVCRYNWHSAGSLGRPFPMLKYKHIFQIKYTDAMLSNSTWKLLWFEIAKMPIAV